MTDNQSLVVDWPSLALGAIWVVSVVASWQVSRAHAIRDCLRIARSKRLSIAFAQYAEYDLPIMRRVTEALATTSARTNPIAAIRRRIGEAVRENVR